uniref:Aminotransferase class V domain-containing protein n=1 Tax=Ciona savignyi TaxID=51511 RepID=H2ZFT9_CIOSA
YNKQFQPYIVNYKSGHTFLDFAGCSIYSSRQITEYTESLKRNVYGNPHSGNPSSDLMAAEVEKVRNTVLAFFNTTSSEYSIIFTSGATAGLKLVAQSFDWTPGKSMYAYLEDNHTSVVGIREAAIDKGAHSVCLRFPKHFKPILLRPSNQMKMGGDNQAEPSHLFAYPAQSNFAGRKYPLNWIQNVKKGAIGSLLSKTDVKSTWFTLLDAAAFVATSNLDLGEYPADFVTVSFYKIFGFPTGIGALLVRNKAAPKLDKIYFGGGTTQVYLPSKNYSLLKTKLHEKFEEGTIAFLDILALRHGFATISRITGHMENITNHLFNLIHWLYNKLNTLTHKNGEKCIVIYTTTRYSNPTLQGATIAFNVRSMDGRYIGYKEVLSTASKENIHLRGGCFCNAGSCNYLLGIDDDKLNQIQKSGYVCGEADIVNGFPVGAVRVSLGYMSTIDDVISFFQFIKRYYVQ